MYSEFSRESIFSIMLSAHYSNKEAKNAEEDSLIWMTGKLQTICSFPNFFSLSLSY